MTKVALIGGAGQIAWEVAEYLRDHGGFESVALCRSELVAAPLRAASREVRVFSTDSPQSISQSMQDIEVVVDCSFAPKGKLREDQSLRRMYEAFFSAPSLRHFIHLSSVAVYGEVTVRVNPSFTHPQPDTVYGAQKLHTERLVRSTAEKHCVPLFCARVGHVYGDGMAWSSIWNKMLSTGRLDESALTKPSNAIHLRQLCQGIKTAIDDQSTGIWNLVGNPNVPWAEVLGWHRRALAAIDPMLCPPLGRSIVPRVRRAPSNLVRLAASGVRTAFQGAKSAVVATPVLAQRIRLILARSPWMPSVASMKDVFGAPAIEDFFGNAHTEEAMYVFDSIVLPDCYAAGPEPLTEEDFYTHVAVNRLILQSGSVTEYLAARLGADRSAGGM